MNTFLNKKLEAQVEDLRLACIDFYRNQDFEKSAQYLLKAWDLLPSPKVTYPESYHIAEYLIATYLKTQDFKRIKYWLKMLYLCDLKRAEGGEREYLSAMVAFEEQDWDTAKYYFWIAYEKSDGRIFKEREKKYIDFYRNEIKGKYPF